MNSRKFAKKVSKITHLSDTLIPPQEYDADVTGGPALEERVETEIRP
jgi:hypothetical protein